MSRLPRPALIPVLLWAIAAPGGVLLAQDPHLDLRLVPGSCSACHQGHGTPGSPMLGAPQTEVCLQCHGPRSEQSNAKSRGLLATDIDLVDLTPALSSSSVHPLTEDAFSSHETGAVTCTSCHSPHRGVRKGTQETARERGDSRRLSPKSPQSFEFQLCQECHGSAGVTAQDLLDSSRLFNVNNTSFHPIEAEASERSPSVVEGLQNALINCTDCHGSSEDSGPTGPHGSAFQYILRQRYVTTDGADEGPSTYELCYSCHDRRIVLDSSTFPLHRSHVVELNASCATCHSAHGSIENRALMRFGEETYVAGVSASLSTGRLEFRSTARGSGACYVTCHGVDHAPLTYGPAAALVEAVDTPPSAFGLPRQPLTPPPDLPAKPKRPVRVRQAEPPVSN